MDLEYIKKRQKQLERKRRRAAELEAKKEAARVAKIVAKMEAEARKQEEIAARVAKMQLEAQKEAARKKLLIEQQEDERLHRKHTQRKEKLVEQKWGTQLDILLAQIKDRFQKDNKLEEIRIIIQNREPSLQELDWDSWLSDPLNQKLADLDFDYAREMFKRDNLMAKRRHGTRGGKKALNNYSLTFTGNTPGNTGTYPLAVGNYDHVTTAFDPDDYNLSEGFTVSYWVRPDEFGNTMFALGRKPSQHERFQFGIQDKDDFFVGVGKQRFRTTEHGMGVVPAGEQRNNDAGTWYHWAVTYAGHSSGKTVKIYRDATLLQETTANWNSTGATGGETVYFGGYNQDDGSSGDEYVAGWACGLDEVAIFDEVKSIGTLYTGVKPSDLSGEDGLVGYWRFEKGSGTTVEDLSGNGNDGTFAPISGDTTALPTWSGDTP